MLALPETIAAIKPFIFPIIPGSKDPATLHGWKDASNDPAKIEEWLKINPNFNWGLACGLSGVFVFDIDPNGIDWWEKLLERDSNVKKAVDNAFQVRTPKGGLHVYFLGEGPSTASRIAEGIDTRGGIRRAGKISSGGYVVLPGSKTVAGPGRVTGSYSELPGGKIATLPSFMQSLIPERKKTDTLGLDKNPEQDLPRNIQTAKDLIAKYIADGRVAVEGKGGDNLTFEVCCSILDKGVSPGTAFDLLYEQWNPHCQPPWDDFELETKVRNAYNHGDDTQSGAKGFQSNADAFSKFENFDTSNLKLEKGEATKAKRARIQLINEYADNCGDPDWLLPDTLPTMGVGVFFGPSGTYKSFLALDLGMTLATGIEGQWGNVNREHQDVLFFAAESPVGMTKKRFPAWLLHWDQEFRGDHRMFFLDHVPLITDVEYWEEIKQSLAEQRVRPKLIIVDTLARAMIGQDENSNQNMVAAVDFFEKVSRFFECFVLLIHHTGKDESKGARGGGALTANADVVAELKKTGPGMSVQFRKQKEADTENSAIYFDKKVIDLDDSDDKERKSLVLLKSDKASPIITQKQDSKPRYDWASVKTITAILNGIPGKTTSTAVLAQMVASKFQLDLQLVQRQLSMQQELKFLHQGTMWRFPKDETEEDL